MVVWKVAIEAGKIALRYGKTIGGITSGESIIIRKLPPHLREPAKIVLKGTATVFHGGLIADLLGSDDEGIGDDGKIPYQYDKVPPSSKYDKAYNRFSASTRRCYPSQSNYRRRRRRSYPR